MQVQGELDLGSVTEQTAQADGYAARLALTLAGHTVTEHVSRRISER